MEGRFSGGGKARGANACFWRPKGPGVVLRAGLAVIATSIPRERLQARDQGGGASEGAVKAAGG
jgi:hypothetical protein